MNTEEAYKQLEKRVSKLEDEILILKTQIRALEYIMAKEEKSSSIVDEVQEKMYRLSKEVTERLKPTR